MQVTDLFDEVLMNNICGDSRSKTFVCTSQSDKFVSFAIAKRVVIIIGEAGMGKTQLIKYLARTQTNLKKKMDYKC